MTTPVVPTQPAPILAAEVCERAGVTYRQLDYWSRRGFIPNTAKGSGVPRQFTEDDVTYISLFSKLLHAGLTHDKVDEILKLGLINEHGMVRLTDHVVLVFEPVAQ